MGKAKPKLDDAPVSKRRPRKADPLGKELAQLDAEILRLMERRAQTAIDAAAQATVEESEPSLADADEAIRQIAAASKGPLTTKTVEAVFRELLSGCRALVKLPRVAILGPLYSYSHIAAIRRFGQSVEYVPVGNIPAVFEEVSRGQSEFGLVPIENSTDGRVVDTLDMFVRMPVPVTGQIDLQIHHALLAKCPRSEIKEIYSKVQPFSQCRNWLAKHLPGAQLVEVTSTSTAAQLAAEKPHAAAIASVQAGVHYGLDILAEKIEDNPSNVTRFAVIGGKTPEKTGDDRTALLFQVEHRPGALAEAMTIFKKQRLNMTWIESFPIAGSERFYLFFVEMEGHQTDTRFRRALALLKRKTLRLDVLGSYPAATVAE